MMYQTFIFLVAAAISAMALEFLSDKEMNEASQKCADELKVDISPMEKIIEKNDYIGWIKLNQDRHFRCHGKCSLAKLGAIDEEGEVSLEKIKKIFGISDDPQTKILADCIKKNRQADTCDRVWEIKLCSVLALKVI